MCNVQYKVPESYSDSENKTTQLNMPNILNYVQSDKKKNFSSWTIKALIQLKRSG